MPGSRRRRHLASSRRPVRPQRSPSPTASKSPRKPRLSGRPIVGRAPPRWLGKRVLPRTADGFGEVRRTPAELVQRRFNLPDQLPALPGNGFASRVDLPGAGHGDRSFDLEAGVPGRRQRAGLDPARILGVRRRSPHGRAPGQRFGGRRHRDGVPAALHERGSRSRRCGSPGSKSWTRRPPVTATTPGSFACRPTPGGVVVLPARVRPRRGREPVPEPLRQRRRGAAGAGVLLPRAAAGGGPG